MINVYIDPSSYVHLRNVLFEEGDAYNINNYRAIPVFLKNYCKEQGLHLQTIDMWNPSVARNDDIYVSFDHKRLIRKLYWKLRNKNYPIVNPNNFRRKVLFHFEPPNVMPEMCCGINELTKMYDIVFFTWKMNNPNIRYFPFPQAHDGIFPKYWGKANRRFLTVINSNRKSFFRHKELLTERIRAILSLSKKNDIDLYGFDWDKPPLFPYWFHKRKIQKVYKGSVQDKYKTLSEYTFALAFESCELPGYITDKIFDCFFTGTIPIYLGAPGIAGYIPTNCFIHMRDFQNYEELRKFLKSLSEEQIKEYKENGRRFLESEQYKQFGKEHFARTFVEACKSNS